MQVDSKNGAILFLPGSHMNGLIAHGESTQPGNILYHNQEMTLGQFGCFTV